MRKLISIVVVFVLTACAPGEGPLSPQEWIGTGQTSSDTYAVRLAFTKYGETIQGWYYLQGRTDPDGRAEGTIRGDEIRMTLTTSSTCQFDFAGTISETRILGTFMTSSCGGLQRSGTWDLLKK